MSCSEIQISTNISVNFFTDHLQILNTWVNNVKCAHVFYVLGFQIPSLLLILSWRYFCVISGVRFFPTLNRQRCC